jgi:hypothetical protein
VENRNHLIVAVATTPAASADERQAGMALLERLPGTPRKTVGGDKTYDTFGSLLRGADPGASRRLWR